MKKILALVFAGMIGGMMSLGGVYLFQQNTATPAVYTTQPYAQPISKRLNVSAKTNAVPFDFTEAAEKATPVVVHISSFQGESVAQQRRQGGGDDPLRDFFGFDSPFDGPKKGTGSGVIISDDGYIVTNNHVVEFADEVEVTLYDNRKFKAEIVGTDPTTDLAVLKVESTGLPTLDYADSDRARVGEWVMAVGNPFDLTSTVTAGIISAKGRNINILSGRNRIEAFIQTDAAVNPGNSGGALVDAAGNLLGINTAIATQTGSYAGYSFAIPVNMMKKIVNDIIEYGSFQRAFLGINISDMDSERAEEFGLNFTQGVVVEELVDGGAAQFAGILPLDVITAVDDRDVRNVPELQEVVSRAKVGETITLSLVRKGKLRKIPVRLKAG
ncbi:MAG: trypsin-like peptidase domain-containing protein [Bacteroidota bacterium]